MNDWPRHYRCAYCKGYGRDEQPRATIRVFAGVPMYGGGSLAGGFPACARHTGDALDAAFATFTQAPAGWEVRAYRVIEDGRDGYPMMPDTPLWTARAGS